MSEIKKVLLTKEHEITGLGSYHKVIPTGIYEVVELGNIYKVVSDGIYKGDNLPKELCQIAKEYAIEYVTQLEIKAAAGEQERDRLRTHLEEAKKDVSHYASLGAEFSEENERLRKELEKAKAILRAVHDLADQPIGVFGEGFGWDFHYKNFRKNLRKVVCQEGEGIQNE